MNNILVSNIIKNIAKKEGVSEADVLNEMEAAIKVCFEASSDNEKRNDIFGENEVPSVEDFLIKMTLAMVAY